MAAPTAYQVTVEFGDCDPMGQVFYPNYARWVDAAAWAFLRRLAAAHRLALDGLFFPVVAVQMQYLAPTRWGDRLAVSTTVSDLGTKSFALHHEVRCGAELRATVTEKRVHCIGAGGTGALPRPEAIGAGLRDALEGARAS